MSYLQQFSDDLKTLVAKAAPAVVRLEHHRGQGSGFLLTPDGYLLTNRHVVADAREVKVRLADRRELKGTVVGRDAPTDLAVVRVDASGLPTLPLAAARPLEPGEVVVAIGNPFRFERSVSLGVVSALDRTLPISDETLMEGVIQTDAAVNPGNSGGPLIDAWGRVVGVTTAIIPYMQGIGFAVPAVTANWVAALLIQRGAIGRPTLGIAARGEELPFALAQDTGQARGVRVLRVASGTPADQAGLLENDLLLTLGGKVVSSVGDLQRLMVLSNDPSLPLTVWRGRARRELRVTPVLQQAA